MNIPKIQLGPYLEIAWRRKLWIIFPFIIAMTIGIIYIQQAPRMYRASTMILVEGQRIPEDYVQSTIAESLEYRLSTISEQINSRTNLKAIVRRFDLDNKVQSFEENLVTKIQSKIPLLFSASSSELNAAQSVDDLSTVDLLRTRIDINMGEDGRNEQNSFEISCTWSDPDTAASVTNAIASQFIEENLKIREDMAMGTTEFLDTEVERIREQLIDKEQELKAFKETHLGTLPDQLQSNLSVLNQLTRELDNLEERLSTKRQERIMLQNQIQSLQSYQSIGDADPKSGPSTRAELLAQLESLLNRYTEKHPDVVALKRRLSNLKSLNSSLTENLITEEEIEEVSELRGQLSRVYSEINEYESKIEGLKSKIQTYNARLERTSQVEMELKDLQRDYETVQNRYDDILNRKLNAQMAEELEKRQKGEQFRVLDPAIPPKFPVKPNIQQVSLMSLFIGLGLGCGLAYFRESLDPALYSVDEVETVLDTKVVISLPDVSKS